MRKRIGIVTWYGASPRGFNFGTCLQSFALEKVLRDWGYDARMISFRGIQEQGAARKLLATFGVLEPLRRLKSLVRTGRFGKSKYESRLRKWNRKHYREFSARAWRGLDSLADNIDCFISGSDQIWNTYHHFDSRMFLDFAGKSKRIAYASSIGTEDVNPAFAEQVRSLLLDYRGIALRESAGVRALTRLTGRQDIKKVLDPSLLLTAQDWVSFGNEENLHLRIPSGYILCYLLSGNPQYVDQVREVSRALGKKSIVIVPSFENPEFSLDGATRFEQATPCEFVRLIGGADVVLTDSFHATALSICLDRPFVEFMRFREGDVKSQNSRIYELLERYGLTSRIFHEKEKHWIAPTDRSLVRKRLKADRAESLAVLKAMISEEP